jgi:hypothetical protein
MRPRLRRIIVVACIVLVVLISIPVASIAFTAWRARWQASRLLGCVRLLHPGTTTEAQAREILKPLAKYEVRYEQRRGKPDPIQASGYAFQNAPSWQRVFGIIFPDSWIPHLPIPRWTRFSADIDYSDGLVAEVNVEEMQADDSGGPHPDSASVEIRSTHFEDNENNSSFWGRLPQNFTGYSLYARNTGTLDSNGNLTSFRCCDEEFITLDERATPSQLADSLNFQLSCLTSLFRCNVPRKIRTPLIKPN